MAVVHGTELADAIVFAGEGAKNLDRPGMKRIRNLVRGGEVDTVIVAKFTRLTRSVRDLADLLEFVSAGRRRVAGPTQVPSAARAVLHPAGQSVSLRYCHQPIVVPIQRRGGIPGRSRPEPARRALRLARCYQESPRRSIGCSERQPTVSLCSQLHPVPSQRKPTFSPLRPPHRKTGIQISQLRTRRSGGHTTNLQAPSSD
jgi:hypothetical protein